MTDIEPEIRTAYVIQCCCGRRWDVTGVREGGSFKCDCGGWYSDIRVKPTFQFTTTAEWTA